VEDRRRVVLRRTGIVMIVLACLYGLYLAGSRADTGEPDRFLPGGDVVNNVQPPRAALLVPRQTPVVVDLATAYVLDTMLVTLPDGSTVQTPVGEMKVDTAQSIYTFVPGAGKSLTELPAGQNCVQVTASRADGQGESVPPYSWCFTVA
jgi:hypothetical protein